jgi:glycyl-tRNA synthetase
MRWNASGASFSRPIRWYVALLGDEVVPFEYAGIVSGRCSRGFRPAASPLAATPKAHGAMAQEAGEQGYGVAMDGCLAIASSGDYRTAMAGAGIMLSVEERRATIAKRVGELAASVGGEVLDDPELLAEVANLVESPTPILGHFAEEYLQLPHEVLVTVMRKHQRYFAVQRGGALLPFFIAVRNGGREGEDLVRRGNEAVLWARFSDASFFYRQDLSRRLEDFLPRLGTLTFHERLGSMLDKTRRLEALAPIVGAMLGAETDEMPLLERAARLAKTDLATQMVVEFTSLQGAIGRVYALRQGEQHQVADAIFEHYLPRSSGDAMPTGRLGLALGLADRLDSILGLFAAGLEPTGSADQYGLRRAALGVVQPLVHWRARIDLRAALAAVATKLPVPADKAVQQRALAFIAQRLRVHLQEQGLRYDVVDAALAERGHDPYWATQTARGLQVGVEQSDWEHILNAFARCCRIVRDMPRRFELHSERLDDEASLALYQAYMDNGRAISPQSTVEELLATLARMAPFITRFFDEVLVMADDRALRENRLAMVQAVAAMSEGIADLSRLEGF